jgi:hypothetical protein
MKQSFRHLLITTALIAVSSLARPCSMFKICANGKTFVGNNEDYWNPETWIWVSNPTVEKLGVVYSGFDNFFPQGGVNERGLAFDGFATPEKENLTASFPGSKNITAVDFITQVMTTCSSIADIKKLLNYYSLDDMASAQLMFVDRGGESIIVEGGNIIVESTKNYQIATNFYQSSVTSTAPITCPRYLVAQNMLESLQESNIAYCKSILKEVHQEGHWGGTQYSNIYDLNEGIIYLYLFHNFDEVITLSVKDLLQQKDYQKPLRSFFHQTGQYNSFRKNYYTSQSVAVKTGEVEDRSLLNELLNELNSNPQAAIWIDQLITSSKQQLSKSKTNNAVDILAFACRIAPRNWKAAYALAEAYLASKKNTEALNQIDHALALKPNEPSLIRLRKSILNARQ